MSETITLKSNIPIIDYKSFSILTKRERKLSQYFRCCSSESFDSPKKCFWSGNDVQKFRQHIQTSHQKILCSFCLQDRSPDDPMPEPFGVENVDKFIDHLLEVHGTRNYQCNRCQYRAKTITHVQLHQISSHHTIWSEKNSLLVQSPTLLQNPDLDICKIIICKQMFNNVKEDVSVWLPRSCPNLDIDLDDNYHYCLHCLFKDNDSMKVFIHSVESHRDKDVCIYSKYSENAINDLESIVESEVSSSESEDDIEVQEQPNHQPLANSFNTKLSLQTNPVIPGLEEHIEPQRKPIEKPPPPPPVLVKDEGESDDSNDEFHNDDMEFGFESSSFVEGYDELGPPPETPTPMPPNVIGNHNIGLIFGSPLDSTPLPCPTASITQSPSARTPKYRKKGKKNRNLKPNEQLSQMNYRQYKEQKRLEELKKNPSAANTSNGSTSQLPPPIDLRPFAKELKQSGLEKNTFKNIKRVGVQKENPLISYVTREEDTISDYVEEISIPKRGIKARFEGRSHFELIIPSNVPNKDKNLLKCLLCSDEVNVFYLREPAIANHLRSVHNTDSSLKCGFAECDFIGQKQLIISHSKLRHPNADPKIEKFIVHSTQAHSIGITSGSHLQKPKTTARKSAGGGSQTTKGSKGALTQRIKESIYMGPGKNDRTGRKRTQSESHEPYERVYNRGTHSSNIRSKRLRRDTESGDEDYFPNSDTEEVESDNHAESETEQMDTQLIPPTIIRQSVAKKSTSKPSSESLNVSITLNENEIPTKYFCVFCIEGFIINNLREAIEHYKSHLGLGYQCNICTRFSCVSYYSMTEHFALNHKNAEMSDNITENLIPILNDWIIKFLNNQIKDSDFTQNILQNNTGINMTCPLCVKASKICGKIPRSFDALWKIKLHICKHFDWKPMQCIPCEELGNEVLFPDHPYLLMKHLVDFHFTSCENLYNISFRGQKPFNEMKKEQISLIEKNFYYDRSSLIINSFFDNLMTELDVTYECQLKAKFNVKKDIQIVLERLVVVKEEPLDLDESKFEAKVEVKEEDKKDIKPLIKSEVKNEVKGELKEELKEEVKEEAESETVNPTEQNGTDNTDDDNWLDDIYGNNTTNRPKPSIQTDDCIVLSSDDE